jgi:hypothetical protein
MICDGCQDEIWSEDERLEPSIVRDSSRFCTVCWDGRICHCCLHYEGGAHASYYTCERCERKIHLECCTAIAWCQSSDVICRDCVKTGDACCARCECELAPDQDTFPYIADSDLTGLLCADCADRAG